jgi:hypothetical protein
MTIPFDALDYAHQLEAAGVPKAQAAVHARTLAEVVGRCAASPADLDTVRLDLTDQIKQSEIRITNRIETGEAKLMSRIETGEAKLMSRIETGEAKLMSRSEAGEARTSGRIDVLEANMHWLKWMMGTVIAMNIGVLIKLYIP